MATKKVITQKELFGFRDMLPKTKIPISAERIKEASEQMKKRDAKGLLDSVIYLRESLEKYDRRLSNGRSKK